MTRYKLVRKINDKFVTLEEIKYSDYFNLEIYFTLWKCENCCYHFAVEDAGVGLDKLIKCPMCEEEHDYDDKKEGFELVTS